MLKLPLCRNLIFTPANRLDRFEKACLLPHCDGIVLDLEDAIAPDQKSDARIGLLRHLESHYAPPSISSKIVVIRINDIKTKVGLQDITALLSTQYTPTALMLPKVQSADEIAIYRALFEAPRFHQMAFIPLIETAYGLQNAHRIAMEPRVAALVFGGADLTNDLGAELTIESTIYYRSRVVEAARSAHKTAWDVPFLQYKDDAGLEQEARAVKKLGYSGKIAIHPRQLSIIARVFSPSAHAIDHAKNIIQTFHQAKGNVCTYQGKMIDTALIKQCEQLLEKANLFTKV